jgi:hypothetical protein
MLIYVKSNIFLPGIEGKESIELDRPSIGVRQFLEELSVMAGRRNIQYVRAGCSNVEDYWEVRINDVDFLTCGRLDSELKDGDTVTINMLIIGGG